MYGQKRKDWTLATEKAEDWIGYVKTLIVDWAKRGLIPSSPYDIDEFIGEGMVALASAIKTYNPEKAEASFKTYLTTCVRNTSIIYGQRLMTQKRASGKRKQWSDAVEQDYGYTPKEIYEDHIYKHLDKLPETWRDSVRLYLQGYSVADIVRLKGVSRQKIDWNIKQAIKAIKQLEGVE